MQTPHALRVVFACFGYCISEAWADALSFYLSRYFPPAKLTLPSYEISSDEVILRSVLTYLGPPFCSYVV